MDYKSCIVIPSRLDRHLGASELSQAVRLSLVLFSPWIGDNTTGLFFFPEYTDHGPTHINRVLAGSTELVTGKAWKRLTSEDAAALVLAAVLHDSAMHLSPDGLLDLLSDTSRFRVDGLDAKTWPELFENFLSESRHWDSRTLYRILGDRSIPAEEQANPVESLRHPKELPNPETWTTQYRKFLGEFLRRHHARLAHEIAIAGVPGPHSERLQLPLGPHHRDFADLTGLIARSHNMQLRDTFRYLNDRFDGRVRCRNIHPIFIMTLLRIADYLEIEPDRASFTQLKIRRLRSPISQEQWDAHLAVHEVRQDEYDTEAVFVAATPKSAREFLSLQELLSGFQKELDTSWAVLGEVFSRQGTLSSLGLKLRRVRSNLDDAAEFLRTRKPSYFPIRASFEAAGPDLLKLLVRPLYGQRPEIGIRELMQNSLDAVRELRHFLANHSSDFKVTGVDFLKQAADVKISIDLDDEDRCWLTISDKGIGMTADTIRDFFLKAGASFRRTNQWKQEFAPEGVSMVLRSGKFGIGALAAFLLGSRLEVKTRHVTALPEDGVRFSASFDDDVLELFRDTLPIGTTIRVELPIYVRSRLIDLKHQWDWFVLDDPKIERLAFGYPIPQSLHLPFPEMLDSPSSDWAMISPTGFQAVYWSFSDYPSLTCNGIKIGSIRGGAAARWEDNQMPWSHPSLHVFDTQGVLPLNLTREGLAAEHFPFSEGLSLDVTMDLCAFLLVHGPNTISAYPSVSFPRRRGLIEDARGFASFWLARDGFSIFHPWHIKKYGVRRALFLGLIQTGDFPYGLKWSRFDALFWSFGIDAEEFEHSIARRFGPALTSMRILCFKKYARRDGVLEYGTASTKKATILQDLKTPDFLTRKNVKDLIFAADLFIDTDRLQTSKTSFTTTWDKMMQEPIIPFNEERRTSMLNKAYRQLRRWVEIWRQEYLAGWRADLANDFADFRDK